MQYERYLDIAPRIILKSTNIKRITNIAKELNIPVFRRKITSKLATNLKVNDYISLFMHKDIAEILAKSLSLKDKKCNKIENRNWKYYYNKGLFYLSKDAFNTGIIYFIKALKLDTNYKIYYCKARAERELGKFTTAIKDYDEAIKLCSDDYRLYYHRAIINGKLDNFKKKIDDCTRAIEINPRFLYAYYSRGLAYSDIGNCNQAIKDFEKVIELDSSYSIAYYQMARY